MIAQNRQVNLIFDMKVLVHQQMSPDDAFNRVADREYISGDDRKNLRRNFVRSHWFKQWTKENPEEAKHLVWD